MTPDASPVVLIENLRFAWPGSAAPVLDIPGFQLARGERVFLAGPSGSGKSTLLSLLGGLILPQAGTLSVMGQSLSAMSGAARDRHRATHTGFVFQQFNLIPYLSLIDNVLLPLRFSPQRAARAAADGGAPAHARRLLQALQLDVDVLSGRPVTQLSVGQQQRVALARALAGGPELVICDEPTSALDADARAAFMALLFAEIERSGAALLFVSHDRALAAGFDRSLALVDINRAAPQGMAA